MHLPSRAPFKAGRSGIQVRLGEEERAVLVQLLGQLDGLLDDGSEASADPLAALVGMSDAPEAPDGEGPGRPEDPALARLLPDGSRDDPEAASEYRRLTEFGLRARKRGGAQQAAAALGREEPVVLTPDEAVALLKAMTDVRLVLGERLELKTDEDAERLHERLWAQDGDDTWLATASVYELLTSWQEYLVMALSARSGRK
jgi:hypothetical protein